MRITTRAADRILVAKKSANNADTEEKVHKAEEKLRRAAITTELTKELEQVYGRVLILFASAPSCTIN